MSVIIFFGICAMLVTVSTIYLAVVFHHYYKLSKVGKTFHPQNRVASTENANS